MRDWALLETGRRQRGDTLGLGGVTEVGSWARSRAQQQQDEVQRTASSPRRGLTSTKTGARALSHELRAPAANCRTLIRGIQPKAGVRCQPQAHYG
jgi:hypothetical protein